MVVVRWPPLDDRRLGTQVSTMTPELRRFFGAPDDAGLLVQDVESNSAAERAGIKVGDVLVSVDGQSIAQVHDVRMALAAHDPDEPIAVEIVRRKKRKTVEATLAPRPSLADAQRQSLEAQLEHAQKTLQEIQQQIDDLERSEDAPAPSKRARKKRRARRRAQKRASKD